MVKLLFLALVFSSFLKHSKFDMMFYHLKMKHRYWNKDMVKVWHGYIRIYLFHYLNKQVVNKIFSHGYYGRIILNKITSASNSLMIVNMKRMVSMKWFDSFWKKTRSKRYFVTEWPIGRFSFSDKDEHKYYYTYPIVYWGSL